MNTAKSVLESRPTRTLYRVGQPGVAGMKGVGELLAAPSINLPSSSTIGANEAKAGVKITIAPYLSMNPHDRITLIWGSVIIHRTVSEAEKGKPVVITVDEASIKQAGDSQKLPVYYFVTDEAGNESEWSEDAVATVQLQSGLAQAPQALDANGAVNASGKIDLALLKDSHAKIQVLGNFQAGDSIVLNWIGQTHDGMQTPITYGPERINETCTQVRFQIPLGVLQPLIGGSAQLTSTLTRNGVQTSSKASFLSIEGKPVDLPAPSLNKDTNLDLWIGADHPFVHVLIPASTGLQAMDEVTVKWVGTSAANQSVPGSSKMLRVSAQRVGRDLPVRFKGAILLKPFDGGWLDVSYEVKRGDAVFVSETTRYFVGYLAESLPSPYAESDLPMGILNPQLPEYEYGMHIAIPATAPEPTPCTVTLIWTTSAGGYYEDEQVLAKGASITPFLIPEELLQIKGDKPVKVTVYYLVEWDDKPICASRDFVFRLATTEILRKLIGPLKIPSASSGKLDLGSVPASGLEIEVPHYEGMAVGDRIRIKAGEHVLMEHVVSTVGKQTLVLPLSAVAQLKGGTEAAMTYEIIRHPSGEKTISQPIQLAFEGALRSFSTSENFDSYPGSQKLGFRKNLQFNEPVNFPGVQLTLLKGIATLFNIDHRVVFHAKGCCLFTAKNTHMKFKLLAPVKQIQFAASTIQRAVVGRGPHTLNLEGTIEYYDDKENLISTVPMPALNLGLYWVSGSDSGLGTYYRMMDYAPSGARVSSFIIKTAKSYCVDDIEWSFT